MRKNNLLTYFLESKEKNEKLLAILVDPDKFSETYFQNLIEICSNYEVNFIFVGGSMINENDLDKVIIAIKLKINKPIIIFPGAATHLSENADAILFLSLISGRNPDFLIGHHVLAAPRLKKSNIEIIPTGYLLIDGGKPTTVSYISNTFPIPADKPEIAATTALAGEYLGLKTIFLDAGSGANSSISTKLIQAVSQTISVPLIVGGGIQSFSEVKSAWNAGADIVVVGTAIENISKDFFEK
ncbi:MAG: geranylgeranylglyceryl/heptaprenylglyceryl phosphate synthase [Cytophagales bacterium]|nr:MAG: geranylgeranylglyceryl/heptaprenylglyceryl phosphate synthase [Cytophagales bacterium]